MVKRVTKWRWLGRLPFSLSLHHAPKKHLFESAPLALSSLPESAVDDKVDKLGLDLQGRMSVFAVALCAGPTCHHATGPFSGRLGCTPCPFRVAGSARKAPRFWKRTSEDHRIWLGRREFLQARSGYRVSFCRATSLAEDLQFCVDTMLAPGSDSAKWRKKWWKILRTAFPDVMGWDEELLSRRCVSTTKVTGHLRPSAHELTRLSILWTGAELATTLDSGAFT